MLEMNNQLLIF